MTINIWVAIAGVLYGLVVGYCFGWLVGAKDTKRRWSDAVKRKRKEASR